MDTYEDLSRLRNLQPTRCDVRPFGPDAQANVLGDVGNGCRGKAFLKRLFGSVEAGLQRAKDILADGTRGVGLGMRCEDMSRCPGRR